MSRQIIIRFDRFDGVWDALVGMADEKTRQEAANVVIASLSIKSYEITDHQFATVKMNVNKGKALTILIPRNIVVTIFEVQGALGKMGFDLSGGTSKSEQKE